MTAGCSTTVVAPEPEVWKAVPPGKMVAAPEVRLKVPAMGRGGHRVEAKAVQGVLAGPHMSRRWPAIPARPAGVPGARA